MRLENTPVSMTIRRGHAVPGAAGAHEVVNEREPEREDADEERPYVGQHGGVPFEQEFSPPLREEFPPAWDRRGSP